MIRYCSIVLLFLSFAFTGYAQEEEDPFADYSYLWEKPEKKKKEKKKKKQQQQDSTQTEKTVQADSLQVADSTQVETVVTDTLDQTTPEVVVDTVNTALTAAEIAALEREQFVQDSIKSAEKAEKQAKRKEKSEGREKPEDFRAGLPKMNPSSSINGGFTYTMIDGKSYVGMVLAPEFTLGKVGVGLEIPAMYGLDDQKFRTEVFTDGVGALRVIRYVRYGNQKVDPVYVKVGSLSNVMIGYGGLMNNYSNSVSYEKRKIGAHFDFNVKGLAGMEGFYSDFDPSSFNLMAVRPYVRPLSWSALPIIETLEVGSTYISDHDQTALLSTGEIEETYKFTEEGISAFGFDAGLTLLRVPFIQIDLFTNYSKLNVMSEALQDSIDNAVTANSLVLEGGDFKKGSGFSAGLNFRFHFIADLLSTDIRIERLSYTDYYLPQFFDTYYEINKDNKIFSLTGAGQMKGIYGSLTGHILKKVQLGGSLMIPDQITEASPATVALNADVDRLADKLSIHAMYFKGGLTDLNDAFKLDDRSLARVRFVYHLNKFMVTGVEYSWAFTPTDDGFKTTQYVSPFFGLSIQF